MNESFWCIEYFDNNLKIPLWLARGNKNKIKDYKIIAEYSSSRGTKESGEIFFYWVSNINDAMMFKERSEEDKNSCPLGMQKMEIINYNKDGSIKDKYFKFIPYIDAKKCIDEYFNRQKEYLKSLFSNIDFETVKITNHSFIETKEKNNA